MSELVQAWMDAEFGTDDTPGWDDFRRALYQRYIPPDHDERLERMFQRMKQRDTLLHYVEEWQVLEAALIFSHVQISKRRKVNCFVEGMKEREERYKVIEKDPHDLQEVFNIVHNIRRVKIMTKDLGEARPSKGGQRRSRNPRKRDDKPRRLNKLEGAAKKKAWDEGACLNCGAKDHFIAGCPKLKTTIKSAVKKYAAFFSKNKKSKKPSSTTATAGSKRLHKMQNPTGTQKEEEEEEHSSASKSDSEISETEYSEASPSEQESAGGQEENSCPESEG